LSLEFISARSSKRVFRAHTQYRARFAGELASYKAVVEAIREKAAVAAAKDLAENIMMK
jgi:hypothetical protein